MRSNRRAAAVIRPGRRSRASHLLSLLAGAGTLAAGLGAPAGARAEGAPTILLTQPTRLPGTLARRATTSLSGSLQGDATLWLRASTRRGAQRIVPDAPDAAGQRAWRVLDVPLQPGRNLLQLRAVDGRGREALRYLEVVRVDEAGEVAGAVGTARRQALAWQGRIVSAELRHGHAFAEGDIDLGEAGSPSPASAARPPRAVGDAGIGIADTASSWPKVGGVAQVPYVVRQGNPATVPPPSPSTCHCSAAPPPCWTTSALSPPPPAKARDGAACAPKLSRSSVTRSLPAPPVIATLLMVERSPMASTASWWARSITSTRCTVWLRVPISTVSLMAWISTSCDISPGMAASWTASTSAFSSTRGSIGSKMNARSWAEGGAVVARSLARRREPLSPMGIIPSMHASVRKWPITET